MWDDACNDVLDDDVQRHEPAGVLQRLLIFQLLDCQSFQSNGKVGPLPGFPPCEVVLNLSSPAANLF